MTSLEPFRSRAYHDDLKWRMVYQRKMRGLTYREIAANLSVDASTAWRAVSRFEQEGSIAARKSSGTSKLTDMEQFALIEAVVDSPALYLRELCQHIQELTGTVVSESAVCRFLQRSNFSRKKLSQVARQRNTELRREFQSECQVYSPDMMVFLDETATDRRDSARKFGYALKGQRARNVRLYCRGKRVSAIAAMAIHGLVDVYCSNGSVDGDTFCEFLERSLLPKLMPFNGINPRSVVVMDNASIHHTRDAIELIQSVGSLVHFLPPYSPDLNPVEELFSKVKYSLKENDSVIQTVPESAIMDIVQAAFSTITDSDCFSWFEHAGYVS